MKTVFSEKALIYKFSCKIELIFMTSFWQDNSKINGFVKQELKKEVNQTSESPLKNLVARRDVIAFDF